MHISFPLFSLSLSPSFTYASLSHTHTHTQRVTRSVRLPYLKSFVAYSRLLILTLCYLHYIRVCVCVVVVTAGLQKLDCVKGRREGTWGACGGPWTVTFYYSVLCIVEGWLLVGCDLVMWEVVVVILLFLFLGRLYGPGWAAGMGGIWWLCRVGWLWIDGRQIHRRGKEMVRGAIITTQRVATLPGYLLCVGGGPSSYDCSCWRPTWGAVKETRSGLWLYMYLGGIVTERNDGDWESLRMRHQQSILVVVWGRAELRCP
jgi:hypothetical protein